MHPLPIFIAGATATGKSAVALALAERLQGEIISVDSMQVYRGMDIGTAKPASAEREKIRHHLIDVASLEESFDAAQFVSKAKAAEAEIRQRGHHPIFCGGTGLYFKAFLEGLGTAPASDPLVRAELESIPLETLLTELQQRDPAAYERIDRQNPRRVVRALEVIRITGKPFSEQRAAWQGKPVVPGYYFGLSRPAGDLNEGIHARVDAMFAQGLVEETRQLLQGGLAKNPTAMQALGYRQVAEHLEGVRDLAETVELVKIRTRQFAKRQLTWFRRQMRLEWISIENKASETIADEIVQEVSKPTVPTSSASA